MNNKLSKNNKGGLFKIAVIVNESVIWVFEVTKKFANASATFRDCAAA